MYVYVLKTVEMKSFNFYENILALFNYSKS